MRSITRSHTKSIPIIRVARFTLRIEVKEQIILRVPAQLNDRDVYLGLTKSMC